MSDVSKMALVWEVFHLLPEGAKVAATWCEHCGDVPKVTEDDDGHQGIRHACEHPMVRVDYE